MKSVAEHGNTLEVDLVCVGDHCIGVAMMSVCGIYIETSKNITGVDVECEDMTVPFCIHEKRFY